MARVCSRYPDRHGFWPSSGYTVVRDLQPAVGERIDKLFAEQREGWQTEVESLTPGLLVGLPPGRSWCKICGAPTMEKG